MEPHSAVTSRSGAAASGPTGTDQWRARRGGRVRRSGRVALAGVAAAAGLLGGAACSDDDDDVSGPGTTSSAATCDAYDDATAAVNEAAEVDLALNTPSEVEASMIALKDAVIEFSTVAGYDPAALVTDVDAALAGMPDADDVNSQQALTLLTSTKDIIVADTRAWLDDAPVDCG